ncbi:hypothetical protein ACDW34_12495 [Acinetobacter piscicola]|uniref:hypothetical protein n=1 Tax=Acinetobacter piscicola TaxID=2006115 RepID=UPI003556963F
MKEIEIAKKYLKYGETLKASDKVLKKLDDSRVTIEEKNILIRFLLLEIYIPYFYMDEINLLKNKFKQDKETLNLINELIENISFESGNEKKVFILNLDNINEVKNIFLNLNINNFSNQNEIKLISIEEAEENIYDKDGYAGLKYKSLIKINKYVKEMSNEGELKIYLNEIEDIFLEKAENDEETVFAKFFDEIIFDIDLITKAYALDKQDELCKSMLRMYQNNLIPCAWHGNYPNGEIIGVKNP